MELRGRSPFITALTAAVLLGVLGAYGVARYHPAHAAEQVAEPSGPATSPPAPTAAGKPASPVDPARIPATGTGQFVVAHGTGKRVGGAGRLVRYQVVVEVGAGVEPAAFASVVEETLADPRGWLGAGQWSFQRVESGHIDLVIHLATPGTVDAICGRYGLHTKGEVSCRGGDNVAINLKRWLTGVPWYADALGDYRHMLLNHEVGHYLGHGHATCPGAGRPAPVMQTQTYGLGACVRNSWPYPDGHTYATGPPA